MLILIENFISNPFELLQVFQNCYSMKILSILLDYLSLFMFFILSRHSDYGNLWGRHSLSQMLIPCYGPHGRRPAGTACSGGLQTRWRRLLPPDWGWARQRWRTSPGPSKGRESKSGFKSAYTLVTLLRIHKLILRRIYQFCFSSQ